MPIQESDGMCRFQCQYGKYQQKQGIGRWCRKSFKISRKIPVKPTNQCFFVVQCFCRTGSLSFVMFWSKLIIHQKALYDIFYEKVVKWCLEIVKNWKRK